MKDIVRTAVAVPRLFLGDVRSNEKEIEKKIKEAADKQVGILVFPECALTGYTCGDLFFQSALLEECKAALVRLAKKTSKKMLVAVGAPLVIEGALYNVAVWMTNGHIAAVVPKTYLPNSRQYSEKRWFTSGTLLRASRTSIGGQDVPCGSLVLKTADSVQVGTEICEDVMAPIPPSTRLALAGAEVLCNLSASDELAFKAAYRRQLILEQSSRCFGVYVYASSGWHESTTDLVFSGKGMIALNGTMQAETDKRFMEDYLLIADNDLGRIRHDRLENKVFADTAAEELTGDILTVAVDSAVLLKTAPTYMTVSRTPFIPENEEERQKACLEIFDMQTYALARRLEITGGKVVVGVSGGLDSTLALFVAVRSMDILGYPRENVHALTLPCFGTTDRTYTNAWELMRRLQVSAAEIRIADSVEQHLKDIGHDIDKHDVTYENSQARERTQVLMDYANRVGAIVLGTGDMSELALGWCTYNADHMSMYGVNAGVPKTFIPYIIQAVAEDGLYADVGDVLQNVIDTPVSPELLPPDESGNIAQKTEELVGPYVLHDFFLYYAVRYGFSPDKIEELANIAFDGEFAPATVRKWLKNFYRRFFNQQFKRSCLPDGVKISAVGLSPRADWKMPSDATAALWLNAIEEDS